MREAAGQRQLEKVLFEVRGLDGVWCRGCDMCMVVRNGLPCRRAAMVDLEGGGGVCGCTPSGSQDLRRSTDYRLTDYLWNLYSIERHLFSQ